MAKIRYLTDLGWPGKIHLVFSVKTERDIIFRDELDALRRRYPNLHVTVTLTRDDGPAWTGERGRISAECSTGHAANCVATGPSLWPDGDDRPDSLRRILKDLACPRIDSSSSPSLVPRAPMTRWRPLPSESEAFATSDVSDAGPKSGGGIAVTFVVRNPPPPRRQTVLEARPNLGIDIAIRLSSRYLRPVQDPASFAVTSLWTRKMPSTHRSGRRTPF